MALPVHLVCSLTSPQPSLFNRAVTPHIKCCCHRPTALVGLCTKSISRFIPDFQIQHPDLGKFDINIPIFCKRLASWLQKNLANLTVCPYIGDWPATLLLLTAPPLAESIWEIHGFAWCSSAFIFDLVDIYYLYWHFCWYLVIVCEHYQTWELRKSKCEYHSNCVIVAEACFLSRTLDTVSDVCVAIAEHIPTALHHAILTSSLAASRSAAKARLLWGRSFLGGSRVELPFSLLSVKYGSLVQTQ